MDADECRKKALGYRLSMSSNERAKKSLRIGEAISAYLAGCPVKPLLCFYPMEDEVDLRHLYRQLLSMGYQLYFPVTTKTGLSFYRVYDMNDFREGHFHVMEPVLRKECFDPANAYIAITPGVAFDYSCNRIGFGKGYYDRFFAQASNGHRIGVAFAGQVFASIPAEEWDVPLHVVVTEKGIRYGV